MEAVCGWVLKNGWYYRKMTNDFKLGIIEGWDDGPPRCGIEVGNWEAEWEDGWIFGCLDGWWLGWIVDPCWGCKDGPRLALMDGLWFGWEDGQFKGWEDGLVLGRFEGCRAGCVVGLWFGELEGPATRFRRGYVIRVRRGRVRREVDTIEYHWTEKKVWY